MNRAKLSLTVFEAPATVITVKRETIQMTIKTHNRKTHNRETHNEVQIICAQHAQLSTRDILLESVLRFGVLMSRIREVSIGATTLLKNIP